MDLLIAEDLLLLLLDDDSGSLLSGSAVDKRLGGALLADLALVGQVRLQEGDSRWSSAKVVVADGASSPDPVLQEALTWLAERKPRPAQVVVGDLGHGLRDKLTARLAERGIVEQHKDRALGLFPRTRWPAVDRSHEARVRAQITDALVNEQTPNVRTAVLIRLLAVSHELRLIDTQGRSGKQIRRRVKEIEDSSWTTDAVQDAVSAEIAAATTAAVTAAVVTTNAGST